MSEETEHTPQAGLERALSALGALCWRRPWHVLATWLFAVLLASVIITQTSDRLLSGSGRIEGSMSDRVDRLLSSDFGVEDGQALILAFRSPSLDANPDALDDFVDQLTDELIAVPSVSDVAAAEQLVERRRDDQGHALLIEMATDGSLATEQEVPKIRAAVLRTGKEIPDFDWAVTGRAALNYDINIFSAQDSAASELRALPLALLVLLYGFGAIVSASLPILLAVAARTVAFAAILIVAGIWEVSNLAQSIVTMLSIALGIDYSLFVYHRYRYALGSLPASGTSHDGDREGALREAMSQSGKVVVYSGIAVAIGMGALFLTPLMQTRSIGLGGLGAVIFSMAAAMTLLPALLALLGERLLDWPSIPAFRHVEDRGREFWASWAQKLVGHPFVAIAASLALLGLLAAPALRTNFGFPEDDFLPAELESVKGLQMLEAMEMKGVASPLFVVVSDSSGGKVITKEREAALEKFAGRLQNDTRVEEIFAPRLSATPSFSPFPMPSADAFVSKDGDRILFRTIPRSSTDLKSLRVLAKELRGWIKAPGLEVEVGGQAQFYNDFDEGMRASFAPVVLTVLAMSGLALLLLLRAPLAALKAIALNLLSVAAGYGAVVFVFQLGHGGAIFGLAEPTGMIPTSVPIVIFGVLFGLSLDYEIFLISRIKDIFLGCGDNIRSIVAGVSETASVITSAALIMAVVFGAFSFSRIVILQMVGLGLAVAIVVDALVIRAVLGPALMTVAGRWNWWPLVPRSVS